MCDKGISEGGRRWATVSLAAEGGVPHCSNYRSGPVPASAFVGLQEGPQVSLGSLASWRLWESWSSGATAVAVVAVAVAVAPRDLGPERGPSGTAGERGRRLHHVDDVTWYDVYRRWPEHVDVTPRYRLRR